MKFNKKIAAITALLGVLAVIPALTASSKEKDVVVLNSQNTVLVNEEVDSQSVSSWIMKAKELDSKGPANAPIYLVMNTPGGSIDDGLNFIEAMKGLRRPVSTVTIFSASMGFQIVQNMGDRLILKNGILMSHRAKGGIEGEFGGQAPSQLDNRYNFYLNMLKDLDQQTVDRTKGKQTLESYRKAYANELWMTGNKSVEDGYADKVVTASCDNSLNTLTHKTANIMGFEVNYDLSNCPLITGPLNVKITVPTDKGPMSETDFLAKGGQFGSSCLLSTNANKLCSLDTTLSVEKLAELKQKFRTNLSASQQKVVYMSFGN